MLIPDSKEIREHFTTDWSLVSRGTNSGVWWIQWVHSPFGPFWGFTSLFSCGVVDGMFLLWFGCGHWPPCEFARGCAAGNAGCAVPQRGLYRLQGVHNLSVHLRVRKLLRVFGLGGRHWHHPGKLLRDRWSLSRRQGTQIHVGEVCGVSPSPSEEARSG